MSRAWEEFRDADVDVPTGGDRRATNLRDEGYRGGFVTQRREDTASSCARMVTLAVTRPAIIDTIARLLVPAVADWCVVFQRDRSFGAVPTVATTYPFRHEPLDCIEPLNSPVVQLRLGVYRAVATRRLQRTTDPMIGRDDFFADDASRDNALGSICPLEVMSIPIVENRVVRVVVTLARTRCGAPFRQADIEMATDVCALAGREFASIRSETHGYAAISTSGRHEAT